jgi:hypothetical protein
MLVRLDIMTELDRREISGSDVDLYATPGLDPFGRIMSFLAFSTVPLAGLQMQLWRLEASSETPHVEDVR